MNPYKIQIESEVFMKFSCDMDDVSYIISTSLGNETEFKYIYFLDSKEKEKLKKGIMKYFTIHIEATKNGKSYLFEVQGVPLHESEQEQMDDVEDFFEGQKLFSKVSHMINLDERDEQKPHWAKY